MYYCHQEIQKVRWTATPRYKEAHEGGGNDGDNGGHGAGMGEKHHRACTEKNNKNNGAGRVALVTPPESRRRHLPADSDPERAQRRGEHPAAPLRQSTEVNRQQQSSGSQGGA